MVEEITGAVALPDDALLDITKWREPKETFAAKVVDIGIREANQQYQEAIENRIGLKLPHQIRQFSIEMHRYDSRFLLPDGTQAPVRVFASWDLETFDRRAGKLDHPTKRSRSAYMMSAWTKVLGQLAPNTARFVGYNLLVDKFMTKDIFPGFEAKNIVLPTQILAPTFVYDGEVRLIEVKREADASEIIGGTAQAATAAPVSDEEAAQKIAGFLRGRPTASLGIQMVSDGMFPVECRREPFLTAFATGQILAILAQFGATVVDNAGTLA